MRIKITNLETNEIEELNVLGFSESGYIAQAGKGKVGVSLDKTKFKIENI